MYICNYEINAMCFLGYHHNKFVATHALAGTNEPKSAQQAKLLQSHCGNNQEGTLFSWLHIYYDYAHLASGSFEQPVCLG